MLSSPDPSVIVQLDDSLAEEVAPGAGGIQGLRTRLLKMQQEKTAVDTDKAIDAALQTAVVQAASAEIPQHYLVDMGRQEFSARIHTAVARVTPGSPRPPPSNLSKPLPLSPLPTTSLPSLVASHRAAHLKDCIISP